MIMKKLFKTTLILAMTVMASVTYATGDETYIKVKSSKSFSLHYNKEGKIRVAITDVNGTILHTDRSGKHSKYLKTFSLSELPIGTYYLEIENDQKISTYEVHVYPDTLLINKDEVVEFYKPTIQQKEDNQLDLSMLKTTNDPMYVYILNNSNDLIDQHTVTGNAINTRFDVSKLKSGTYSMVINVGRRQFTQQFNVN